MSRVHALCGVSAAALGLALVAPVRMASAQNAGQTLPPVTVEAPTPARAKPAKREAAGNPAARAKRRNVAAAPPSPPPPPTPGAGTGAKDPTAYSVPDSGVGTKTDTPILVTPASIQVVPQQVLKDQQVTSTDQAVKNVSGVAVGGGLASSNGQPYASVFIRGFTTDTTFRDGTRLDNFGSDSSVYLQQYANVDRVEVLKGPAAILYGAVEPGGILNIVTKQPQSTPVYSLEQQAGSFGFERTTINATGPASLDGRLLYRLDTSYDSAGSQVDNVKTRNFFVAPVLLWNIDADNQIKAEFNYRSSLFGQNFGFLPTLNGVLINTNPSVNYGGYSPAQETATFAALSWMHRFDNDWSIKQRAVFNANDVNSAGLLPFTGPGIVSGAPTPSGTGVAVGINNVVNNDQNVAVTTDVVGHFDTPGIAHTLLLGTDYGRFKDDGMINQACEIDANCSFVDLFNPITPGTPFAGPTTLLGTNSQLTQTVGVYAQDQLKLPAGFYLLGGVRWQYLNQQSNASFPAFGVTSSSGVVATALTPRVGILWQPRDWLSLYSSYTTSFGPAKAGFLVANGQGVPPSAGQQWEEGVKFAFFGGKLTATAAYFDLTKTNIPSAGPTNSIFVTVIGKVRSTGFEFDMQGEVSPGWNVIANYAHTDARVVDSGPLDVAAPVGSRLGDVPIDLLHLWTTYEFQAAELHGWKIGGGMTFAGPTPFLPESSFTGEMLPTHTVFDLMTAYQFESGGRKWTFQVNATNIFNRVYLNEVQLSNSIPSPVAPFSWFNGAYGPLRTIVGSLRVEL